MCSRSAAADVRARLILVLSAFGASCAGLKQRAPARPSHGEWYDNGEALELATDLAGQAAVDEILGFSSRVAAGERSPVSLFRRELQPRQKLWPKQEEKLQLQERRLWLFGAHHKAGTILTRNLAFWLTHELRMPPCVDRGCEANRCTLKTSFMTMHQERTWYSCSLEDKQISSLRRLANETGSTLRGVHIIRDPLALVVSGYLYHMHSDDHVPDKAMRNMSMIDGITLEARFALKTTVKEMVQSYQRSQSENGTACNDILIVRLEDIMASSEGYDRVMKAIFNHTVGDFVTPHVMERLQVLATQSDIRRHPLEEKKKHAEGDFLYGHVAQEDMKRNAKRVLKSIPKDLRKQLKDQRKILGY